MLHQKRDTKNTPRRQVVGTTLSALDPRRRDGVISREWRETAGDFEGPLANNGEDRTGWLGRQDSNLRIRNRAQLGLPLSCGAKSGSGSCTI